MRDKMANMPRKIRVLICNEYALFRECIKSLLRKGTLIEIVGEAGTGRLAVAKAARLNPDVVLMDLMTPDLSGSEATRRIKAVHPAVRILILSLRDDKALAWNCLEAGASGYIRQSDQPWQLRSAIDAACTPDEYRSKRAGTA